MRKPVDKTNMEKSDLVQHSDTTDELPQVLQPNLLHATLTCPVFVLHMFDDSSGFGSTEKSVSETNANQIKARKVKQRILSLHFHPNGEKFASAAEGLCGRICRA